MRPEARSRARRARRECARVRVGARGGGGGVGPLGRGSRYASRHRGEGRRGDALANRGVRAQRAHARGTRRAKGTHARWTTRGGTRRRLGLVRMGRVDEPSRGDEPRRVIRGGDEGRRVVPGMGRGAPRARRRVFPRETRVDVREAAHARTRRRARRRRARIRRRVSRRRRTGRGRRRRMPSRRVFVFVSLFSRVGVSDGVRGVRQASRRRRESL